MTSQFPFLSSMLATVLAGALVIMVLPEKKHFLMKLTACISGFIVFALAITVYFLFDQAKGGFQFIEKIPWLGQLGITYHVGIDGIGLSMVLLTGIVLFTGVLISSNEFAGRGLLGKTGRPKEFFALLLVLVAGVFGVFMSMDLFFLFLFYELAVLPMYLLIGIWGTGKKEYSAMKLTLYLLFGSALILVGILAVYFNSGLKTFDLLVLRSHSFNADFQNIFFPVMFIGFGILAGLWPFHTWSPDGHASAPSAVSMLHAGVLMKLGAFSIIRVALELFPQGAKFWCPVFAVLTIVNIVYGALVAMSQKDLKYVIAYSSVSHMGIVMFGICSLNALALNGAVFQMFSHGVMTGLFFALVGCIYGRTHTRILSEMGGLAKLMPFIAAAFTIGGLTSLGLPGTSGFISEFLVFVGAFRSYPALTIIAAAGIVITAIYVLRVVQKIFFAKLDAKYTSEEKSCEITDNFSNTHLEQVGISGHNGSDISISDANLFEKIPLSILIFFLILFGVWPSFLINVINLGVSALMQGGLF